MLDDNYICYKTIAPLYVLCCYNCTLFSLVCFDEPTRLSVKLRVQLTDFKKSQMSQLKLRSLLVAF